MAMPTPKLQLTTAQREGLAELCCNEIDALESAHTQFFHAINVWWDWYEAKPKTAKKSQPWPNASNVVVPLIASMADSVVAEEYATIFSHGKVISGRSLNEQFQSIVPHVVDFLNWGAEHEFDLKLPVWDWLLEKAVIGESVLGLRWERKERWVLVPGSTSLTPKKMMLGRGPIVEHIPRHRLLWEPGKTIEDSETLVKQAYMSYSQLARMAQSGDWYQEAVEKAKDAPDYGSPQLEIEKRAAERHGQDLEEAISQSKLHDVRECWMDVPLVASFNKALGEQMVKDRVTNMVVTYHRGSNQVLRAMADPYGLGQKPFYESYYRKRSGQPHGRGLAKMLEHLQRSMSTSVNQGHDAVTRANAVFGVTTNPKVANRQLSPNEMILVDNIQDVIFPNLPKSVFPEVTLTNLMQVMAERLSGRSDALMGRESRSGGHPSPATNFLGMMEQGKILASPTLHADRRAIGRLLAGVATLYQLFDTDEGGRVSRVLGARDGAKAREWLFPKDQALIGNIQFDIFAVDEQNNPQTRQQMMVTLMQMSNNYTAFVLPLLQAAINPEIPAAMRSFVAQAIQAHSLAFQRFLEASDVDDVENFTILAEEMRAHGIADLRDYQRQAEQFRQLEAATKGREESVQQRPVGNDGRAAQAGQAQPTRAVSLQ